jgi:hypothetical protein
MALRFLLGILTQKTGVSTAAFQWSLYTLQLFLD